MEEFIDWAFYGKVPKCCTPEVAYKCYLVWCELFKKQQVKKFEFIKSWSKYMLSVKMETHADE